MTPACYDTLRKTSGAGERSSEERRSDLAGPVPAHRRGCKETEAAVPKPKKGAGLVGLGDGMIPSGPSAVDIAEMEGGICSLDSQSGTLLIMARSALINN